MASEQRQWFDLEMLDVLLEREKMAHSPDVWINIHRLLLPRAAAGVLPDNAQLLANLLGPLVCKTPQHQQRLVPVINEWISGQKPFHEAQLNAPQQPTVTKWQQQIRQFNRRSLLGFALLFVLLVGLALAIANWPQQPEVNLPKAVPEQPVKVAKPITTKQSIPMTDWVAPNPLPPLKAIPGNWVFWLQLWGWVIPGLPILAALIWLIWRYRGQTVLQNKAPQGDKLLTQLNLDISNQRLLTPFNGPEMSSAVDKLVRPSWIDSRRLDVEESVIATANQSGFFTPRYRQQHIRPEYLVLVQSIHGSDQSAAFAELLVEELRKKKVAIRSYRFRDDPRRLIPWIQPAEGADKSALSLAQLAERRGTARLIVISDWDILFQPYRPDQPHDWIKDFKKWLPERRTWLSPGFEQQKWAQKASEQAKQLNFRLLPLGSPHIVQLVDWLTQEGRAKPLFGQTSDEFLPDILAETSDSWLDWRPPQGTDIKRLDNQLREYLKPDGFLLLQALAVFPKPLWPLPHVLDIQLFAAPAKSTLAPRWSVPWRRRKKLSDSSLPDSDETLRQARELRLLRMSRLPWSRYAFMPDYLRLRLLKQLNKEQRSRIRLAWASLLTALSSGKNREQISLPVAMPKINKVHLRDLLKAQPKGNALNDPIFANIIMGGKLGLLDFRLNNALAKLLPGKGRWLDLRPALTAIVLTLISVPGLNTLWETQGKQALTTVWQDRIDQQNAAWQVNMNYQSATKQLADIVVNSLRSDHFNASQALAQNQPKVSHNQINYPVGGLDIAKSVAQIIAWHTYGAPVQLTQAPGLPAQTLVIQLGHTYQHTAGFQDSLRNAYQSTPDIKEINAKISGLALEPDLVIIPAGSFLMGSPDSESDRSSDEGPQHQVTIAQSFAIGKNEVTFDEYDRFAKATKGKLPDDSGWGRGKRPVINVSYSDVQAYVAWLSKQSGNHYWLPTEAEWEYAARAGTATPYSWSDKEDPTNFAWFAKNSDNKTQPVGEKRPNAFGLYDMSGNVWEWTQDCWHNNYQNAPLDGSAWLESGKGDCKNARLVRGGSWYNDPQYLRSAGRYRYYTDGAINILGFRVARAL